MSRNETRLTQGWQWRPEGQGGEPLHAWQSVEIPAAWQRYPRGWNHRGLARYRFELPEPSDPHARRWLLFKGVQYDSTLFLDGRRIGRHEGGWDPFFVPLPESSKQGRLEVLVESIGPFLPNEEALAGFLPDCGILPCGIWKEVRIIEAGNSVVEGVRNRWMPSRNTLRIEPQFRRAGKHMHATWGIELFDPLGDHVASAKATGASKSLSLFITRPRLWSLEDPSLYTLRIHVQDEAGRVDRSETGIGLRTLAARNGRVLLNGKPVMLRGVLHWGYDPERIAPSGDEAALRREIESLKTHGFNMVKHCLYVPDDEYFRLGDRLGMLQWLELPMWLPSVSPAFQKRALREVPRIVAAHGHHPSLAVFSLGCELGDRADPGFLNRLFRSVKRRAPDSICCDNSGSGECYGGPETDLSDFHDYHFYAEPGRLPALMDRFGHAFKSKKPWIFGEFCDSDAIRDLGKVKKTLNEEACWWLSKKPEKNPLARGSRVIEIPGCLYQEARLEEAGLGREMKRLEKSSKRHSMAHRKLTLETVRGYPLPAGYVITGIRDTAVSTSGIIDDLGRPRFDESEFRKINSDTLLMVRGAPRRAWVRGGDRASLLDLHHQVGGERLLCRIAVSHFSEQLPAPADLTWKLLGKDGTEKAAGILPVKKKLSRGLHLLGEISLDLPETKHVMACTLSLSWPFDSEGSENAWPIWVHPAQDLNRIEEIHLHDPGEGLDTWHGLSAGPEARVWVTCNVDADVIEHLEEGGGLILVQSGSHPMPSMGAPFWREAMHLKEDHPLARNFPFQDGGGLETAALATDRFFTGSLEGTPFKDVKPILTRLDMRTFSRSYSLVELEGYPGTCIATTLRPAGGAGAQPLGLKNNVGGRALLAAVQAYLAER
ncbi:MAG: glycoside hydrolase family 2 TIM barrel-domain containing protein [Planctomycetota bacterium]